MFHDNPLHCLRRALTGSYDIGATVRADRSANENSSIVRARRRFPLPFPILLNRVFQVSTIKQVSGPFGPAEQKKREM